MAIYPAQQYPAGLPMGTEVSLAPVNGSAILTVAETSVVGQSDPVELGEPCIVGGITGVCINAPTASGDPVVIQTEGIFSVPVKAHDGSTTSAVSIGETVYINATTAIVSVDTDDVPFGRALSALSGSATPALICVKLI